MLVDLPAKWKKAIPAGLTGLAFLVQFFFHVLEVSVGWFPNVLTFIGFGVGLLLGVLWTPPDTTK